VSTNHITNPRIEVVNDSEYAVEVAALEARLAAEHVAAMAQLEALRDEVLAELAASGEPELARELLDGWNSVAYR
jgi:hypothetical protein